MAKTKTTATSKRKPKTELITKKTNRISELALLRRQSLDQMQPETRAAACKMDEIVTGDMKLSILARHKIGVIAREVRDNMSKYPEDALEKVGNYVGLSPQVLGQCIQIATVYSEKRIIDIIDEANSAGVVLYWNHFERLAGLYLSRGPDLRITLEKEMIEEDYSVLELQERIQQLTGRQRQSGAGRPPVKPKTAVIGLMQIAKLVQTYHRRMDVWDLSIFDFVSTAGEDQLSDTLLDMIDRTMEAQQEHIQQVQEVQERLSRSRNRIVAVLSERTEAAEHAESNGAPVKQAKQPKQAKPTKRAPSLVAAVIEPPEEEDAEEEVVSLAQHRADQRRANAPKQRRRRNRDI